MEFTSQICTTKEQSERLLALGLKKETADMYIELTYSYNFENNQSSEEWEPHPIPYSKLLEDGEKFNIPIYFKHIIPAWSLHRLIEMYSEHYVCEHINLKLITYDTIIENIRLDILTGTFNKEYLEQ